MKTIEYRHGENQIIKLDDSFSLDGWEADNRHDSGEVVVGHSETGAHHVVVSDKATLYRKKGQDIAVLVLGEPTGVIHRGDRHKVGELGAGKHAICVKRQYEPADGTWSQVQD